MYFVQPTFNLQVKIWRFGAGPPVAAAVSCLGNLSPGKIVSGTMYDNYSGLLNPGQMWLRLPAGTDIRDSKAPAGPDLVEVPAGTGRYYTAWVVDDIGGGFANEHRFCILANTATWPVPFPGCGGGSSSPPAAPVYLASGNSGMAAVNAYVLPVNQTAAGYVYVCVHVMQAFANVPTATIGVAPPAAPYLQKQYVSGGLNGLVLLWRLARGVGAYNITITMPGITTGYIQALAFQTLSPPNVAGPTANAAGFNSIPTIAGIANQPLFPNWNVAVFGGQTWAAAIPWAAPFALLGIEDVLLYGLGTGRLTVGHMESTVGGVFNAALTGVMPQAWGGIETSDS